MIWREIETAPKSSDGSIILLAYGGSVWPGFWSDGQENYWKRAGWYDAEDRVNILTAKPCSATHWMPLPDPPENASVDREVCQAVAANALIAAAPELLEACREMVAAVEIEGANGLRFHEARN